MKTISKFIPEIYCFVHATYSGEPILQFMNRILRSLKGPFQGDPLASLKLFSSIHRLLKRLVAELRLGFMDDITLAGKSSTFIKEAGAQLGLLINASKCEIIYKNTTKQFESSAFEGFQRIELDHLCLLSVPILRESATDNCLREKCIELNKGIARLSILQAHEAMIILKNSLSIPKLMYILRTADCCDNKLLTQFDNIVSNGLWTILNCELSGEQILQASLPVKAGGLVFRSSSSHAPSAFLASAAGQRNFKL